MYGRPVYIVLLLVMSIYSLCRLIKVVVVYIYIILLRKRKLTKLRFGLCLLKEH